MYLDRDDWRSWCPELVPWLEAQLSREALDDFHEGVEPTWLEWLDTRTARVSEGTLVERFKVLLKQRFHGVRVVHATRLRNLHGIRESGLRAWSAAELRGAAQTKYGDQTDAESLRRAIEQSLPEHRGGKVYTFSSLSHALSTYGGAMPGRLPPFTLSGGEFIDAVGAKVGLADHAQRDHRAYFIACNLPWSSIPADTLAWLIGDLLCTVVICRFLDTDDYRMEGSLDCIHTERDISPEQINAVADVESLRQHQGLVPADIVWQPFP